MSRIRGKKLFLFVGAAVLVLILIRSINGNSSSTGDRFFELEQSISAVVKDWNACSNIPEYDVNATGIDGAFAKSYDALQVTCDLLPQESTEALLLINEQISPIGTQANIDYHSSQIALIIEKRRKASLDSLDAMMPYLSKAQKENAERMRMELTR